MIDELTNYPYTATMPGLLVTVVRASLACSSEFPRQIATRADYYATHYARVAANPAREVSHWMVLAKFYTTSLLRICLLWAIIHYVAPSDVSLVAAALVYGNCQLAEVCRVHARIMALGYRALRQGNNESRGDELAMEE
ncbi:unnamed protein product [Amoebophrya sp. A25]|nr:unnamed protein product [Amoebophrya sp. A25]|eukprot:GSA25T00021409001.1